MTILDDVLPVVVVMCLGLVVIWIGPWFARERGVRRWTRFIGWLRPPGRWSSFDRETAFSTVSDFEGVVRSLPSAVQLEMAEHLIEEKEFARASLEVVQRFALGANESLRWRSMKLLESEGISLVTRVSLAERVLRASSDARLKIYVVDNLVKILESEPAERHLTVPDAIAIAIAARLGDGLESVRLVAAEKFYEGGALYQLLPIVDRHIAHSLCNTKGEAQRAVARFISAHDSRLPWASAKARCYGLGA